MDDQQLARLVDQVEQAFPNDLDAQRAAWEFLEVVMAAWDEADATDPVSVDPLDAGSRLLGAFRNLIEQAGDQLASGLQVLTVPQPAALTLSRSTSEVTLALNEDLAERTGVDQAIAVDYGADHVTLMARVDEAADISSLVALVYSDAQGLVRLRFERLEPTVATAYLEIRADEFEPMCIALLLEE